MQSIFPCTSYNAIASKQKVVDLETNRRIHFTYTLFSLFALILHLIAITVESFIFFESW